MTLTLLYDGGCPFCRNFAARSELSSGVRGLQIIDGREDHTQRQSLSERGFSLAKGAVLIEGETVWHGSAAIAELCRRMEPSDQLLGLLKGVFCDDARSKILYPALLLARQVALNFRGLSVDPDH
jgi:predicted DCC family thiol-disulfide oxidoreductase YuxK